MADETDDPEIATARLEAALERIAARETATVAVAPAIVEPPPEAPDIAELAARLDGLIDRLRGALSPK